MAKPLERPRDHDLYETDFYAWTQAQAEKLRARTHNDVDWENLAEEIESVGLRELRDLREWYAKLIEHLLLWQAEPDQRCHSWQSAISEARTFIDGILETSPSLASRAEERIARAFEDASQSVVLKYPGLDGKLPHTCPWSFEQLADISFMPGRPWSPDELLLD